jgi:signal transduction histidine kinase
MTLDSWLSLNNPVLFSFVLLIVILAVVHIFYRYAIIPLRKKHLKEAKNIRLQQAELTAMLAKYSPDPIFRFDENGEIILSNDAARDAFRGNDFHLKTIHQLFPEMNEVECKKFIESNDKVKFLSDLNGKTYQWIVHGIQRHSIAQIYGRDITELIEKDEKLREALEKARRANDLKDDFLSRISHEIRSPLFSVQSNTRLVYEQSEGKIDDEYRELLLHVENGGKRLSRTVDLLVNMSMIHTKTYELKLSNVDLYQMIYFLYREFLSHAEIQRIDFLISEREDIDYSIEVDEYSLGKVFENLLHNAFTFTHSGTIKIIITNSSKHFIVVISDTGQGISEEYKKILFKPFSQEQLGYTREYDGLGLGLTLVKRFIELNDAEISCESEEGVGTRFEIKLKKRLS